jgi:surfactin synthase thioesterase subunit
MTLLMLPYAGASRYSYDFLIKKFPPDLNIVSVDLPGRGKRLNEKLQHDLHKITKDVLAQVCETLKDSYAIYGHSMGTVIGLLLARKIADDDTGEFQLPKHMFFSGRGGPSFKLRKMDHKLPKPAFIRQLKTLDPESAALWDNPMFTQLYEPILRNDFRAHETYKYLPGGKLEIPITVLIGKDEDIDLEHAHHWQDETNLPVTIRQFTGGHFFIRQHAVAVAKLIGDQIASFIFK